MLPRLSLCEPRLLGIGHTPLLLPALLLPTLLLPLLPLLLLPLCCCQIPVFFRWLYEISFLRYAFNLLKINQWEDIKFDDCDLQAALASACPAVCYEDGDMYLSATEANELSIAQNFLVLLCFAAVILVFSFVSMRMAIMRKATTG